MMVLHAHDKNMPNPTEIPPRASETQNDSQKMLENFEALKKNNSLCGSREIKIIPPAQGEATKNIIYIQMYHNKPSDSAKTIEEWLLIKEKLDAVMLLKDDESEKNLSEEEGTKRKVAKRIVKELHQHVTNLIDTQTDIYVILNHLQRMGITTVILEGITAEDKEILEEIPAELKQDKKELKEINKKYQQLKDNSDKKRYKEHAAQLAQVSRERAAVYDTGYLATGPFAQFKRLNILPGEDPDLNRQTTLVSQAPFTDKKELVKMQERRDRFIIQQALQTSEKNIIIMLGAAHDLTGAIAEVNAKTKKVGKGDLCNLIIITPTRLPVTAH